MGTSDNQWAWEALPFPPPPLYPHLAASGVASIGQAVSSSESWVVCQALETEWGNAQCVCQVLSPPD